MASLQCTKPAANPGHKTHWPFGHHAQQTQEAQFYESEIKYTEQTQVQYYTETSTGHMPRQSHSVEHSQCSVTGLNNNAAATAAASKKWGEHRRRRGLLQKIKDGLSGHSDSDSCSSSDSENDEKEKCVKGKN